MKLSTFTLAAAIALPMAAHADVTFNKAAQNAYSKGIVGTIEQFKPVYVQTQLYEYHAPAGICKEGMYAIKAPSGQQGCWWRNGSRIEVRFKGVDLISAEPVQSFLSEDVDWIK